MESMGLVAVIEIVEKSGLVNVNTTISNYGRIFIGF